MEMPNMIYADLDLGSEDPEAPYFAGEYKDNDPISGKYHHDRIVQALKRENEELKAKYQETDILYWQQVREIEELKAKHCEAMRQLEKAKDCLRYYMNISLYEGVSLGVAPINEDRGQRARTTLAELNDVNEGIE